MPSLDAFAYIFSDNVHAHESQICASYACQRAATDVCCVLKLHKHILAISTALELAKAMMNAFDNNRSLSASALACILRQW